MHVPLPLQLDEPLPEQGGSDTRIAERRPLLLVPVPAESAWAAAVRADAARASLTGILGTGAAAAADGGAGKRQREPGAGEADGLAAAGEDVSMSMMVSDATGQTTADDCDSAAARARRGTGSAHPAGQEASSAGAASPGADLPGGCCMTYVSGARFGVDVDDSDPCLTRAPAMHGARCDLLQCHGLWLCWATLPLHARQGLTVQTRGSMRGECRASSQRAQHGPAEGGRRSGVRSP